MSQKRALRIALEILSLGFGIWLGGSQAIAQKASNKNKPKPAPVWISDAFTQVANKIPAIKSEVRNSYIENVLTPDSPLALRRQDIISNKLKFDNHVDTHTISLSPFHFSVAEVPLPVAKYFPTFLKDVERIQYESFLAALSLDHFILPGTYNYRTDPSINSDPATFEFPYFFSSALMNRFVDQLNQAPYDRLEAAKWVPLANTPPEEKLGVLRIHEHSALVKSLADLYLDHFHYFGKWGYQDIAVKQKNFVYFTTNNTDIDLIQCRRDIRLTHDEEHRAKVFNYIIGLSRGGDWEKHMFLKFPEVITEDVRHVLMRNFIHTLEQSFYAQFQSKLNINDDGFFFHLTNNKKPFVLPLGYSKWMTLMVYGLAEQGARMPPESFTKPAGKTSADSNLGDLPYRRGSKTRIGNMGVGPGYALHFRDRALDFAALFRSAHQSGARVMTVTDLYRLFKFDSYKLEVTGQDGYLIWALTDFLIRGRIGTKDLLPGYRAWVKDLSEYILEVTDPATDQIMPGKLGYAEFQRFSFLENFADSIVGISVPVKSRWVALKKSNPKLLESDSEEGLRFQQELDFVFRDYIYAFEAAMTEWMFAVYEPEFKMPQLSGPITGHGKIEGLVTQLVQRPVKPARPAKR
jgi:hypothetical protein